MVSYAEAKEQQLPEQAPVRPNKAVYVGGLPPGANSDNLTELFAKYGEVNPPPIGIRSGIEDRRYDQVAGKSGRRNRARWFIMIGLRMPLAHMLQL